jgi:hypothetical protein
MNDLEIAARIGLGAYETPNEVLNAIAPALKSLIHTEAENAGVIGAKAAEKAVWKAGLIGGAIGIVGGGLLGFVLARKFR